MKKWIKENYDKLIFVIVVLLFIGALFGCIKFNDYRNEIVETYESKLDEMDLYFDEDKKEYDVVVNNKHYLVNYKDTVVLPHSDNEIILEVERDGDTHLYFYVGVYNEEA